MDNFEEKKEYYYKIKDIEMQKKIRNTWQRLISNKIYRAQLKRSTNIKDILSFPYIRAFRKILPQWTTLDSTAVICGILAHVDENGRELLEDRLAIKKGERPVCSEEKLYLLVHSKTCDELYKNLRRLISHIKGNIDPLSIIDFVLQWEDERRNIKKPRFNKSLIYKIYNKYYSSKI
jgi:CRISPR type I-E-associated protein CasB/Cse2